MFKSAIEKVLLAEGWRVARTTKKVIEFQRGAESIYLKVREIDHPLVVHGKYAPVISKLIGISGVNRTKALTKAYHNSNMRSFDVRHNTGKKPTRYGFDFGFDSATALLNFLRGL